MTPPPLFIKHSLLAFLIGFLIIPGLIASITCMFSMESFVELFRRMSFDGHYPYGCVVAAMIAFAAFRIRYYWNKQFPQQ